MMRENRNIVERTGATSELSSRRNLVGMLSGPDALLGLRLASSFSTPDVVIVIAGVGLRLIVWLWLGLVSC